jgi:hypothetical protein
MSTIQIRDSLRQAIETASGGEQTVLYTAKGQPTFMTIVPAFSGGAIHASLAGSIHPAFATTAGERSSFMIGTYQGVIKNGELVSQPNQRPTTVQTFENFFLAAKACGNGFHIATNAEYAALGLLAWRDKQDVLGNTYYGRSAVDATQYGRRADSASATAGITTGDPVILTGSGPVSFRTGLKYNGVSDLVGNLSEHNIGLRMVNREIQVLAINTAAQVATFAGITDAGDWKAIDATNGTLITPNGSGTTSNSVKVAFNTDSNEQKSNSLILTGISQPFSAVVNNEVTPISAAALRILRLYGILSVDGTNVRGYFNIRSGLADICYSSRGGTYQTSGGGLYSLDINMPMPATSGISMTARPAYIV